jgi:hypothetical protein
VRYTFRDGILLLSLLLCPLALRPQMPPQPGKLVITSEPPGATVTINGNQVNQHTNATFLVSPGSYTVTVISRDGKLSCSPPTPLRVTSGQTVTGDCSAAGWKVSGK